MLVSEPSQVALADWPWSPSVTVNDDSTGYRYGPSIAVDPSGNACAVWTDGREDEPGGEGYEWDIYGAYRPAEGNWGANAKLNDEVTTWGPWNPSVAMDTAGNAYAVWVDEPTDGVGTDIYFAYRASGGDWTTAVKVNDDSGSHNAPSVAADATGKAYALWACADVVDEALVNHGICFSYRPAAGPWSAAVRVNDSDGWVHPSWPSIAADANGNAYALWVDGRNSTPENPDNSDIYFAYRPAGGTWGPNVRVNDDTGTAAQTLPTVAVDGSGTAYAVWSDRRAGRNTADVYFARRRAGGNWSSNIKVNDNALLVDGTCHPDIAADANGNAYAVWAGGPYCDIWQDEDDCHWAIYFAYRPTGGAWGTNLRVNDWAESGDQPSLAIDASGNSYVVWHRGDNIRFAYWPPRPGDWAPYKMTLIIVFKNYSPP
jgi:hypothetical protein